MKMKLALKAALASAMCAMFGGTVSADASSITVDSVAQRWPWNNKLDITYTVSGGQNVSAGVYAKIVFTATIDGIHINPAGRFYPLIPEFPAIAHCALEIAHCPLLGGRPFFSS